MERDDKRNGSFGLFPGLHFIPDCRGLAGQTLWRSPDPWYSRRYVVPDHARLSRSDINLPDLLVSDAHLAGHGRGNCVSGQHCLVPQLGASIGTVPGNSPSGECRSFRDRYRIGQHRLDDPKRGVGIGILCLWVHRPDMGTCLVWKEQRFHAPIERLRRAGCSSLSFLPTPWGRVVKCPAKRRALAGVVVFKIGMDSDF